MIAHLEPVVDEVGERQRDGEHPAVDVLQRITLGADQRYHLDRMRAVGPDHCVVTVLVCAQNRVRVVVLAGQQPVEVRPLGARWSLETCFDCVIRHSLRSS